MVFLTFLKNYGIIIIENKGKAKIPVTNKCAVGRPKC